jgi:ABC-2 type transport system permease protein
MNSRLISIIRKEFIQLFRDKRLLALILILPLVELFLLGYAATNEVRNIPVAVFDQSHSPDGRSLLDAYRASDYFMLAYSVNSDAELRQLIEKGQAGVWLIIPPDYATRLQEGNAQVAFILDGSDPTMATTALSAAQLIAQRQSSQSLAEKLARSGVNMEVQPQV